MAVTNPFRVSQADRNKFCTKVIDASAPSSEYYFMILLSTLIVAMGLLADNIILVIGGMLVTPLLSAVLAFALGVVIREGRVIKRSIKILLISLLLAFSVAFLTGMFSQVSVNDSGIIKAMKPTFFILLSGVVAGLAASFAWVKPHLNDTLPGIAVTVTLIPPLTAIGLTVAHGEWILLRYTTSVFFLNLAGIIFASLVTFSLMEFFRAKSKAIEEIKEEEKELKKK